MDRPPTGRGCRAGFGYRELSGLVNVARNMKDLAARRLRAQRLIGEPFKSPVEAVRRLTAVQSQDYPAAKWALGLRSRRATDAGIDRLFDEGDILRTHVMRPTWHFVLPEDVKWLLDLTAPRIRRGLVARHRQLELDDRTIARASAAFAKALAGGRHLTRPELGQVLRAARISPEGQRLPHLLSIAELEGLIVSGPGADDSSRMPCSRSGCANRELSSDQRRSPS